MRRSVLYMVYFLKKCLMELNGCSPEQLVGADMPAAETRGAVHTRMYSRIGEIRWRKRFIG